MRVLFIVILTYMKASHIILVCLKKKVMSRFGPLYWMALRIVERYKSEDYIYNHKNLCWLTCTDSNLL